MGRPPKPGDHSPQDDPIDDGALNYFNLDDWLQECPLKTMNGHYRAEPVTGPGDVCNNVQLRDAIAGQIKWGKGTPVDIFVMAQGEADRPWATKIAGLPSRPAKLAWPTLEDGQPMLFLAQFNFTQSKDLVGDLPGDLLLLFVDSVANGVNKLHAEWHMIRRSRLIAANEVPKRADTLIPSVGYRFRTMSFQEATRSKSYRTSLYPTCNGIDVWQEHFLYQWYATQIGVAPFFIQKSSRKIRGRVLCTVASMRARSRLEPRYINSPSNVTDKAERSSNTKSLSLVDFGCIYVGIDDAGDISWRCSSF